MINFSLRTKIFMACDPIDMRRGFDSLAAWVDLNLGRKVLDGDVFLFLSKRRDRIKIMWWEGDGYCLFYKRLEVGTFEMPKHDTTAKELVIDSTTLSLLLRGIETGSIQRRKRFDQKAG
jgi:transposase